MLCQLLTKGINRSPLLPLFWAPRSTTLHSTGRRMTHPRPLHSSPSSFLNHKTKKNSGNDAVLWFTSTDRGQALLFCFCELPFCSQKGVQIVWTEPLGVCLAGEGKSLSSTVSLSSVCGVFPSGHACCDNGRCIFWVNSSLLSWSSPLHLPMHSVCTVHIGLIKKPMNG